jgi:hypothetical protein
MDREQMVDTVARLLNGPDHADRAVARLLASKIVGAILPQVTTVEELEALALPLGSMLVDDSGSGILHWGHYPRPVLERHIETHGPLTVVWRPS